MERTEQESNWRRWLTMSAWEALSTRIPYTPSLKKFTPTLVQLKRTLALAIALITFHTQVLCAGTGTFPLMNLPVAQKVTPLLDRLMKLTGQGRDRLLYVFHSNIWEDRDKVLGGRGSTPDSILKQEQRQQDRMDIQQQNIQNRGTQLPTMQEAPGKVSPEGALGQIKAVDQGPTPGSEAADEIQRIIEQVGGKMKKLLSEGGEFKYKIFVNKDGSIGTTYFKNGNTSRIENRVNIDAHGNYLREDVDSMEYNQSGLLEKTVTRKKDSQGRETTLERTFVYQEGAKFYDQDSQLVEEMGEKTTTTTGATKEMHRKNMKYDANHNLTDFYEKSSDENGKKTERWWWGATYDENKNLMSYKEVSRSNDLDTYVEWTGGTYVENPHRDKIKKKDNEDDGHSDYLLTGYNKLTRTSDGLEQRETWRNMGYDEFDNMISYEKSVTDYQDKVTKISWSATYDKHDRMTSYKQTTADTFGNIQVVELSNVEYNKHDDMVSYRETTTEAGQTRQKIFTAGTYDKRHNLTSYYEKIVDSQGLAQMKEWSALDEEGMGYNSRGELIGYHEVVMADGL
ncbi:MAG TPA: hypothetical protein PK876_08590, partial [Elusimicrobiota bacterium]|nr:hypothetical protein [Elusimicrobiota bacterium]